MVPAAGSRGWNQKPGRACAAFRASSVDLVPLCYWQSLPCSTELQHFWFGAERQHQQAQDAAQREKKMEPTGAMWTPSHSHGSRWSCSWSPRCSQNHRVLQSHSHSQAKRKGHLTCFKAPITSHQVLSSFSTVFQLGGKLGQEHPRHTAFVCPYTTWLSVGPVTILPLAGKCHQVLSSGSVLFCPVVNALLRVKHSLYYILLLTLLQILQFFSKL